MLWDHFPQPVYSLSFIGQVSGKARPDHTPHEHSPESVYIRPKAFPFDKGVKESDLTIKFAKLLPVVL